MVSPCPSGIPESPAVQADDLCTAVPRLAPSPSATLPEDAVFSDLLNRRAHGTAPAAAAMPGPLPVPGQVLLGRLQALPSGGEPGVAAVPGLGLLEVGHSLVPWAPGLVGQGVALSLLPADRALLLGPVWEAAASAQGGPDAAAPASPPLAITVDGHRRVVEAGQELELRCGDAAIVLTADGRIQLRGTYITSHASATQRIVGGSVHVN